jgi:hypothetical protein
VTYGLLGIFRHQPLELALGPLVVSVGLPGLTKQGGKLCPGVGGIHVDHLDRFDSWLGGIAIEQSRRFAGLDRSPKGLFSRDQDGLVDRVSLD